MAGPGSRLEKAGTIFSRVRGLLRSGALKESEKPLWYDVYAAYPPRVEQDYSREAPDAEPINILYKEDLVRAKFYKAYGNPGIIDMRESTPSLSQKFIDKYFEIRESKQVDKSTIFESAAEGLKVEGIRLKGLEEMVEEKRKAVENRMTQAASGQFTTDKAKPTHADDTIDEDMDLLEYNKIPKE